MAGNTDIGIVVFANERWQSVWMNRHHIMSRLANYYKVLWISSPTHWRDAARLDPRILLSNGLQKITPSLWTYDPEKYLPTFYGHNVLNTLCNYFRNMRIKHILSSMNVNRVIAYICRPEYIKYINSLHADLICYHIDDEYSFSSKEVPTSELEIQALKRSDVVFIHSKTLIEKKASLANTVYYVPMGVDFAHYRTIAENSMIQPEEICSIPRPRIGYVGRIKEHINLKVLLHIARKRKDWSLVLVGPIVDCHVQIQKDIELLRRENNVYFLGAKDALDLPAYIKNMDVGLMCYHKNAYTDHIYPLKLHEYLACGIPIVARELENLKEFKDVLNFAITPDEWIEKIQTALNNTDPDQKRKRVDIAETNSWDSRVKIIRAAFEAKLLQR